MSLRLVIQNILPALIQYDTSRSS